MAAPPPLLPPLVTAEERAASPNTSFPTTPPPHPCMGLIALRGPVQGLYREITAGITTVVDTN